MRPLTKSLVCCFSLGLAGCSDVTLGLDPFGTLEAKPLTCTGGLTRCGEVCVDTTSDVRDCGACNAACEAPAEPSTVACVTSRCVVTLASGQNAPSAVTIDAKNAYWTNSGVTSSSGIETGTGDVVEVSLSGGTPVTLASQRNTPSGIAVDSANLYWTEIGQISASGTFVPGTGAIYQVSLSGGTPITLASGRNQPIAVVVDPSSNQVCWTEAGMVSSDGVWVNGSGAVMSVPIGGGALTTVASGQDQPYDLALSGGTLYWANVGQIAASGIPVNGSGSVMSASLPGGSPQTLASGQNEPVAVAADATQVLWINFGVADQNGFPTAGTGSLMQLSLSSDAQPVTLLPMLEDPASTVVVEDGVVYWANAGQVNPNGYLVTGSGAVSTIPEAGGSQTVIASAQNAPATIFVSGTYVCWVDTGPESDGATVAGAGSVLLAPR